MAKKKSAAIDTSGYSFATGQFTEPPPSASNPDFSKMPAMKPVPSHAVTRPTKRAPIQRALTSGGR